MLEKGVKKVQGYKEALCTTKTINNITNETYHVHINTLNNLYYMILS